MEKSEELVEIVRSAKEFEKADKLTDAKHRFLDAASFAIQLSKNAKKSDMLSLELIARELLKYAKELQLEILLDSQALPSPPSNNLGEGQKIIEHEKEDDESSVIPGFEIYQLMVVKAGGTPLISYEFEELPENTKLKLNEILFTGAITAVSQLMKEVLEKAIQAIRFEGGVLMTHTYKNLQFILFAKEEDEVLFRYMKKFANDFCTLLKDDINNAARTGMTMEISEKFKKLVLGIFVVKQM